MYLKNLLTIFGFGFLLIGIFALSFFIKSQKGFDIRNKAAITNERIYWGARIDGEVYGRNDAPWDDTTWTTFENHAGKKVSIIHWGNKYPASFSYDSSIFTKVRDKGVINLYSWDTGDLKLSDIASGLYDSYFSTWAQEAANSKIPFFLRFNWEMNGNWYPWGTASGNPLGNTASDYVNMWRRVHNIFEAAQATNVTWVWCPNTIYSGSAPLNQLYPGDSYVDWVCFDGYNWGSFKGGWQSFDQVAKQTYDTLTTIAPSKPIMIAEIASTEQDAPSGTSKAAWITDFLSRIQTNYQNIKAIVWFNWNILEANHRLDWQIESSQEAQNAFKNGISSNYFAPASNNFATLPPSPINPLLPDPKNTPSASPTLALCPLQSAGDANCDDKISLVDFEAWRREFIGYFPTTTADFNNDGRVSLADFEAWRRGFLGI